jgi:hypothetical protein
MVEKDPKPDEAVEAPKVVDAEDPRLKLVYDEALGAASRQEESLNELRARAGALLGSAIIAVAFFATLGIRHGQIGSIGWAAIAGFVTSAALLGAILVPLGKWRGFRRDPGILISSYVRGDPPATIDEMHEDLAIYIGGDLQTNDKRLGVLWWVFTAALAILVVDVVLWTLAIGNV